MLCPGHLTNFDMSTALCAAPADIKPGQGIYLVLRATGFTPKTVIPTATASITDQAWTASRQVLASHSASIIDKPLAAMMSCSVSLAAAVQHILHSMLLNRLHALHCSPHHQPNPGVCSTGRTARLIKVDTVHGCSPRFLSDSVHCAVIPPAGVSRIFFGLTASPCRECPSNMVATLQYPASAAHFVSDTAASPAKGGYVSPLACVTKPGFGFSGRGATKCARGSWNPAGNLGR